LRRCAGTSPRTSCAGFPSGACSPNFLTGREGSPEAATATSTWAILPSAFFRSSATDLRSLLPLDWDAILQTVRKTGKALIVHEAARTGGVGGEVAALIAEEAFESLDSPVMRPASKDTPVPHSPILEVAFQPQTGDIADAMRRLAAY
jgi:hypothetical protein